MVIKVNLPLATSIYLFRKPITFQSRRFKLSIYYLYYRINYLCYLSLNHPYFSLKSFYLWLCLDFIHLYRVFFFMGTNKQILLSPPKKKHTVLYSIYPIIIHIYLSIIVLRLLGNECNMCEEKQPFRNFLQMKKHMNIEHKRFYCDLCVDNLKVILRQLYVILRKF